MMMERFILLCSLVGVLCVGISYGENYTIDSVMVTHNGSSVPVIGSSTVYTITCDVTISCDGTCNENDTLTISWSLNGNDDTSSSHTVSSSDTFTSTLTTMGDVSSSHAGLYQCIANLTNAGTGGSDTIDFNVKLPAPTVEVTTTTVLRGSDAVLTCTVTAVDDNADDLSSNIVWSPNRGTAGVTTRNNNIFTSTYTISNVVFDDAGIYTCTATIGHTSEYVLTSVSESGTGSVSITIPAPTVVVTTTTVIRGDDAVLTCTVTAVNDNAEGLTSNIVWSPNTGTAGVTTKMNNVFTSIYTISNVVFDDAGIYTCMVTIGHTSQYVLTSGSGSGTGSVSITIPAPTVVVTTTTVIRGSNAVLTCTVTAVDDNPGGLSSNIVWSPNTGTAGVTTKMNNVFTLIYTISNVVFDDAGIYTCMVTIGHTSQYVLTSGSGSGTGSVSITIPAPTVEVTTTTVIRGSNAVLTCTVTAVDDNPDDLSSNIVWSPNTGTAGVTMRTSNIFTSTYTISNVVFDDAGIYTCTADISHTSEYVLTSGSESGTGSVYITGFSFNGTDITRLDTPPYNGFSILCSIIYYPINELPSIDFSWTDNNTQDSITFINSTMNNTRESIQLVEINSMTPNTVNNYIYTCQVSVEFSGSNPLELEDNAVITVKGSSLPDTPQLLTPTSNPTSITINWRIPSVLYTPETFIVLYGTSSLDLSMDGGMSRNTDNDGFLTDTDQDYSVTITNLNSDVLYYYQVVVQNTIGNTSSDIRNITTQESPPGPPNNVELATTSSTSLTLSWEAPQMPNGVITGYNYMCIDINDTTTMYSTSDTVSSDEFSVDILNLRPYTKYMCSVNGSTSAGVGTSASDTAVTSQAAPSGPPTLFNVTSNSSNPQQLILEWEPPSLEYRNGIIINYNYNCTDDDSSTSVQSGSMNTLAAIVNGLRAFTNHTCYVTALTNEGAGPAAVYNDARTAEDEPSEVQSLDVIPDAPSSFDISWSIPATPNGIIRYYIVTVRLYSDNSIVTTTNSTDVYQRIDNLDRYTPYIISVSAVTGGGTGMSVNTTDFTQQGTPGQVQGISVNRTSGTMLIVTWTELTLEEAQGFVTNYIIRLTPVESRRRQNGVLSMTVGPDVTIVIFGTLVQGVAYDVTVSGSTEEGEGTTSVPFTISTIPTEEATKSPQIVVIVVVVVIGSIVLLALIIIITILIFFLMRAHSSKEGVLNIHENEVALQEMTRRDNGESGKNLKLLKVETTEGVDSERLIPIPIKTFPQHTRELHMNRDLGFEEEYKTLANAPKGTFMVSKLANNLPKNRFDNVFSYDESRVKLAPLSNTVDSDYINASFISGYKRPKAYIAAQGPLPNTIGDFWRMIWEYQLPTIVMLTELIERGVEKCVCYLPRAINETMDVGYDLKVTLIEQQQFVGYKFKKFLLVNTSETGGRLDCTHYHFTAWPDHGVPADKTVMIAFVRRVRQNHPPEGPPLIVHCSAGVGRTGTFITLDTMLQRIDNKEEDLNVYEFLVDMRSKRTLMVQTEAQYVYIHDALTEYITCSDTSVSVKHLKDRMNELSKVSDGQSGYQKQLKLLNEVSKRPSEGHCTESLSRQNMEKNRYSDVISSLPYNMTRVHLKTTSGVGDYINASFVDGYKHRSAFLATQAPLETTVGDFWRMIWDQWSPSIVMLYTVDEEDANEDLFAGEWFQYWPEAVGDQCKYGMMEVKFVSEKREKDFIVRKFELSQESNYVNLATGNADQLIVTQYHYQTWSPQSKPLNPSSVLELLNQLLRSQKLSGNKAITVMCNDGIDRTGAFICIYSQLERVKIEGVADIFQFIKGSRFQRPNLVENVDNYIFCHELLMEFLNTFDQYENFK